MKKKISILFLILAILMALVQSFYSFDGTLGFMVVTLVASLLIFSIILGEQVKEFFIAFAKTFL